MCPLRVQSLRDHTQSSVPVHVRLCSTNTHPHTTRVHTKLAIIITKCPFVAIITTVAGENYLTSRHHCCHRCSSYRDEKLHRSTMRRWMWTEAAAKGTIVTTCSRAAFSVGIANSAAAGDPWDHWSSPLKDVAVASSPGHCGDGQHWISDCDGSLARASRGWWLDCCCLWWWVVNLQKWASWSHWMEVVGCGGCCCCCSRIRLDDEVASGRQRERARGRATD